VTPNLDWLPERVLRSDYGSWPEYEAVLLEQFTQDYIDGPPAFLGQAFYVREGPLVENRHATFWHLITEGEGPEELRTFSLDRCACIRWARAILGKLGTDEVCVWRTHRPGIGERMLVALPDFSYVVVLALRPDYVHLVTAYAVQYARQRELKRKECEAYCANKGKAPK